MAGEALFSMNRFAVRRPSYLILAVLVGGALVASVVAFRRYLPYTGVPLSPKQPPTIMLAMEDAYLVGLGGGGKQWSVRADRVEISQNRSSTTISRITDGRIYDKGKVALKVRAGRAAYDIYSRNLLLSGGIGIEGPEGQRVRAEGATWNSYSSVLRSNGQVSFESKQSRATADSLTVDLRKQQMDLLNIRMRINAGEMADLLSKEAGAGAN